VRMPVNVGQPPFYEKRRGVKPVLVRFSWTLESFPLKAVLLPPSAWNR